MMTCCAVGRLDALEYLLLPHNVETESSNVFNTLYVPRF